MLFHSSDRVIESPKIDLKNSLCLTDDLNVARLYQRGGPDVQHRVYKADWDDARIADEETLGKIAKNIGMPIDDKFKSQPYLAMKHPKIREAVVLAGYDGVEYEDTHDGINYQTTELLRHPKGFNWELYELQDMSV